MDIPQELFESVLRDYKEQQDSRLLNTLMEEKLHHQVFGKRQAILDIEVQVEIAINKYVKDNELEDEG